MRLRPIEENMVVHCKTENEAKKLIRWAHFCGYSWTGHAKETVCCSGETTFCSDDEDPFCSDKTTFYEWYKDHTCYHFENNMIDFCNYALYAHERYELKITEFSDLIISEEPHMSAEEIVEWLQKNLVNVEKVFGRDDMDIKTAYDVLGNYPAYDIIRKIETYEAQKSPKKELEIESVYRVYNYKKNKDEFYPDEETAIDRCKELIRLNPDIYAKYEKVLRIKE